MTHARSLLPAGTRCSVLGLLAVLLLLPACTSGGVNRTATPSSTTPRASTETARQWYEGGTLHSATLAQWKAATNANRLATAADWLAATEWRNALRTTSDFQRLKIKAQMLVNEVNEVASDPDLGFMSATETAAAILTLSDDFGP